MSSELRWRFAAVVAFMGFFWCAFIIYAAGDTALDPGEDTDLTAEEDLAGARAAVMCILAPSLVVTLACLYVGVSGKLREDRLKHVAAIARSYRRVRMDALASRLERDLAAVDRDVRECIAEEYLSAYVDRNTGEVITEMALWQDPATRRGWVCRGCGARNDRLVMPGEVGKCEFCGMLSR